MNNRITERTVAEREAAAEAFSYTNLLIDSRDVIARLDFLTVLDETGALDSDDRIEMFALERAIENIDRFSVEGAAAGVTLIRDEFFVEYVQSLAKWCGDIPEANRRSPVVVDWEATAESYRKDFASLELAGARYWFQ